MLDTFGRPLKSLRVSLIDKCNLRCQYCMPEEEYVWLPRDDILTVEQIGDLVDVFSELGVDKVRLTGGEPLLRREAADVVERLAANPDVRDLSMTTNGVLLAKQAESLRSAGLDRVTVSLDTLRPERFKQLTRRDCLPQVLEGIDAAVESGLKPLKINTVVMRGYNDDELTDMIDFSRDRGAEIRFIEYMDVGGATRWSMDLVVSRREILSLLEKALRADRTAPRQWLGSGGPLWATGRDDLRHHRLNNRAVLQCLRSEPAHCGWDVVPVSVCGPRDRPSEASARAGLPR